MMELISELVVILPILVFWSYMLLEYLVLKSLSLNKLYDMYKKYSLIEKCKDDIDGTSWLQVMIMLWFITIPIMLCVALYWSFIYLPGNYIEKSRIRKVKAYLPDAKEIRYTDNTYVIGDVRVKDEHIHEYIQNNSPYICKDCGQKAIKEKNSLYWVCNKCATRWSTPA